jgi:hypothetical protein
MPKFFSWIKNPKKIQKKIQKILKLLCLNSYTCNRGSACENFGGLGPLVWEDIENAQTLHKGLAKLLYRSPRSGVTERDLKYSFLKVIGTHSVGHDHINPDLMRKHGIKVGYTPGVLTNDVADLTVCLTLMTMRRIKEHVQ